MEDLIIQAVNNVQVVDVHTHLFPPNHGDLMLWGIDSLLTYHYLISEYFMTSGMDYDEFFNKCKEEQADLVWNELFVNRSPISEATRGVLMTLKLLGLEDLVEKRDLLKIRLWFKQQDPKSYVEKVFNIAKVRYCVMTNIPFDEKESIEWEKDDCKLYESRFKSAVRVDPLLKGDCPLFFKHIRKFGFQENVQGAQNYLEYWCKKMDALYFMASTPQGFKYIHDNYYSNKDEFEYHQSGKSNIIATEFIDKVFVPVAKKLGKPLVLKLGANRGLNPCLNPCGGGDGVEKVDLDFISLLCNRYPKLKLLVTVLSMENQHQLVVLANKHRNLHIYGCWWYCNNPSMIETISKMRLELLGTGFTIQHSDARVLDQLLYKWYHSRQVIVKCLLEYYQKLQETGWRVTKKEIDRDVDRLFGRSFEEFLEK